MTIITAQQKNLRQSSRKVRLVANQVKKLELASAVDQLAVMQRRSSLAILKVIKEALANALNNHHLEITQLVLSDIVVSDGPILKRMRAVSRGRGHSIEKRTCHVTVVLKTRDEAAAASAAKPVASKPSTKPVTVAATKPAATKVAKSTATKVKAAAKPATKKNDKKENK